MSNTKVMPMGGVVDGGFNSEQSDGSAKPRYVKALKTSYLNGTLIEEGQVTVYPRGVEKLGHNLAEVDSAGNPVAAEKIVTS